MRYAIPVLAATALLAACGSEQPPAEDEPSNPGGDLPVPLLSDGGPPSPASASTDNRPPAPPQEAGASEGSTTASTDDGPPSPPRDAGATEGGTSASAEASAGSTKTIEVVVEATQVTGPYPADVLERIIANEAEPIRWCVGKEVGAGAELDEQLLLRFEVVPRNAKLQNVEVESRKLGAEAVECIVRRFALTRFQVIKVDKPTRVRAKIEVTTVTPEANKDTGDIGE